MLELNNIIYDVLLYSSLFITIIDIIIKLNIMNVKEYIETNNSILSTIV